MALAWKVPASSPARRRRIARVIARPGGLVLFSVTAAFGLGPLGCNGFDPIPQEVIDSLPEEEGGNAQHRPGEPCVVCHDAYGGATPAMAIGGTVFKEDPMTSALLPAPGIKIVVNDSKGDLRTVCTNAAGNFFIEKEKWEDVQFPLKVTTGPRRMSSIIGRSGSCATCHQLPSDDRPGTGVGRDSAGVVIVEDGDEDPTCGGGQ